MSGTSETPPAIDLRQRSAFGFFTTEQIRFADLDLNGHVNNLSFLAMMESARQRFIAGHTPLVLNDEQTYMLVHLEVDFVGELHYPGAVEAACRVVEVRRSSVVFGQALFAGERAAATLKAVTVNVDRRIRKAAPFTDEAREKLLALLAA